MSNLKRLRAAREYQRARNRLQETGHVTEQSRDVRGKVCARAQVRGRELTPTVPKLRPIDSTRIPSAVKSRKCDASRDIYTNVKECTSLDTRYHDGGLMELATIHMLMHRLRNYLKSLPQRRRNMHLPV
ncbi:hypothetical protein NDU88_006127 [Pleurodeles waltl]|uniref:Uncharacterized protein n=1 Tax=Pleurodeles waltl TaxID=8319 RepID=A0AAV7N017_PLEWA|nr:hypothetical protein NDU88_006127 [Pleurodeles waltl]